MHYATAEHWMTMGKVWLFGGDEAADRVVKTSHPNCARHLGCGIRGLNQGRWGEHRFDLVTEGNRTKFPQYPNLQESLPGAGERVLVKTNPADRIWGAELTADSGRIVDPHSWHGLNPLGFTFTTVRDELAETT